jgi:hypothetical protein
MGGGGQNPSQFSRALGYFVPAGYSYLVPKKAFNENLFHCKQRETGSDRPEFKFHPDVADHGGGLNDI